MFLGSNMRQRILFRFREKVHEGVIRDVERQQRRKAENLYNLQQQIDLTKQLQAQYDKSEDSVT